MSIERTELDPPIDPGVGCGHCAKPIVAVAMIRDAFGRRVVWRHAAGLTPLCRVMRPAEPRRAAEALVMVEALMAARQAVVAAPSHARAGKIGRKGEGSG